MNGNICIFLISTPDFHTVYVQNYNSIIYQLIFQWRRHQPASNDMLLIAYYEMFLGKFDF